MSALRKLTAFLFLFFLPLNVGAGEDWYSFEDHEVVFEGTIIFENYFGPPNYGENPDTDSVETAIILNLVVPIKVRGNPEDLLNSETFSNVLRVHLVISLEEGREEILSGKKVSVTGTLFSKHTGHHRTDVLMFVKELKIIP